MKVLMILILAAIITVCIVVIWLTVTRWILAADSVEGCAGGPSCPKKFLQNPDGATQITQPDEILRDCGDPSHTLCSSGCPFKDKFTMASPRNFEVLHGDGNETLGDIYQNLGWLDGSLEAGGPDWRDSLTQECEFITDVGMPVTGPCANPPRVVIY